MTHGVCRDHRGADLHRLSAAAYKTSIAGLAATTDNLNLSANDSVTSLTTIKTVNALLISGNVTLTIARRADVHGHRAAWCSSTAALTLKVEGRRHAGPG